MAPVRPPVFDILNENYQEICRCQESLEALYYTCGTTEIALEHLMRPYNPTGFDYKSIVAQMQNFKDVIDRKMRLIRLLYVNFIKAAEHLHDLKTADDPDMVEGVDHLNNLLSSTSEQLKDLILEAAHACRGFHHSCSIVLNFLVEQYCLAQQ